MPSATEVPVARTAASLREAVAQWKRSGQTVAFVPTMGHLHAGHLSLVTEARRRADRVVVSIFVNPLQFAAGEDFAEYPRELEADCAKLAPLAPDLVFAPDEKVLYPHGQHGLTQVVVPGISQQFCGAFRPGHFEGVTTVVSLLFHLVQPDCAVFGQKDYQQLSIIRRMVRDLHMPVQVIGMPTVREPSGLAMSSRNAYLSEPDRDSAVAIYRNLRRTAQALEQGRRDFAALEAEAVRALGDAGLEVQFFAIRRRDLDPADPGDTAFVVLAAAKLGATRLIDNMEVDAPPP